MKRGEGAPQLPPRAMPQASDTLLCSASAVLRLRLLLQSEEDIYGDLAQEDQKQVRQRSKRQKQQAAEGGHEKAADGERRALTRSASALAVCCVCASLDSPRPTLPPRTRPPTAMPPPPQ